VNISTCERRRGRTSGAPVRVRRTLRRNGDPDCAAVLIAEPQRIAVGVRRRVDARDAERGEPLGEARHVLGVRPERQRMQLLARPSPYVRPPMSVLERVQREHVALVAHIEPEAAVERARRAEIGNVEAVMVERVNADLARAPLVARRIGHGDALLRPARWARARLVRPADSRYDIGHRLKAPRWQFVQQRL
jgi:hypothetical protein